MLVIDYSTLLTHKRASFAFLSLRGIFQRFLSAPPALFLYGGVRIRFQAVPGCVSVACSSRNGNLRFPWKCVPGLPIVGCKTVPGLP